MLTITNKTNSEWITGFRIPAGGSVSLDVPMYLKFQKNYAVFMDAYNRGDLAMEKSEFTPRMVVAPTVTPKKKKQT